MVDLTPDSFPGYRPLLHRLAALWEPPSTTESTPTTTPATLAGRLNRAIAELLEIADSLVHLHDDGETGESAPSRRRRTRRPKRVVTVNTDTLADREHLWLDYFRLKLDEVSGRPYRRLTGEPIPTSKAYFAIAHNFNSREFVRWFAPRHGIASGTGPDLRIRAALDREIARMSPTSHGSASTVPIDTKPIPPHD